MNDDILDRTWAWLQDASHPVEGLVAQAGESIIGFAHYWPQPRPLQGQYAGFLDDLLSIHLTAVAVLGVCLLGRSAILQACAAGRC